MKYPRKIVQEEKVWEERKAAGNMLQPPPPQRSNRLQ